MYCMRKMRQSKKIFDKKEDSRGVAMIEFACFLPIAMMLLYMIIDLTSLFTMKYKVQNITATAAQNTMAVASRHRSINISELKEIAETTILSFQGNYNADKYEMYMMWECIQNKEGINQVAWSAYCHKPIGQLVSDAVITNGTLESTFGDLLAESNINVGNAIMNISSNPLNISHNKSVIVITVIFKVGNSKEFYRMSQFTFNIVKNSIRDRISAQTVLPLENAIQLVQ